MDGFQGLETKDETIPKKVSLIGRGRSVRLSRMSAVPPGERCPLKKMIMAWMPLFIIGKGVCRMGVARSEATA